MNVVPGKPFFHLNQGLAFIRRRGIDKLHSGPQGQPSADFGIMIHKTGNAALNTRLAGSDRNRVEVVQVVVNTPLPGPIIAYWIKAPVNRTGSKMIAEILELFKALRQRRYMGLKYRIVGMDGKIEKQIVALFDQMPAKVFINKWTKIFGPEYDRMNIVGGRRHHRDTLVKWIYDLEKPFPDLCHKPGHVESRDIGSAGGGYDRLLMSIH